jgi:hypothetical protein
MPIYALTIFVLFLMVCYLIHRIILASKEKIVVLMLNADKTTSWKIFDSMVDAKAFMGTNIPKKYVYTVIRTTDVNKCVPNGH